MCCHTSLRPLVANVNTIRNIAVLGATGSVGTVSLGLIAENPKRYRAYALSAHTSAEEMARLCAQHRPRFAVMRDANAAERLERLLRGSDTAVLAGEEGLQQVAKEAEVDTVIAAIVGVAGLAPALAAARAGKRLLLANKEALVSAGSLFMETVEAGGAELLPVDSEHSAVMQCLPVGTPLGIPPPFLRRILLTASGGPFWQYSSKQLASVTPAQAVAHPVWKMGHKISVDSATLVNKGLELIEACYLFGLPPSQVDILVHPGSIVHSLVEFLDGSVLAQMAHPDMRVPLAAALAWPERIPTGVPSLDLAALGRLEFETPLPERFPCLALARAAAEEGGSAPTALNAANEVAVDAFLSENISFTAIPNIVEAGLHTASGNKPASLDDVLHADEQARQAAWRAVHNSGRARIRGSI